MAGPQDCAWSEGYAYDGFGNLTDKNVTGGTAPSLHVTVDAATNHVTGYTYDPNGNLTNIPSQTGLSYDVENRTKTATPAGGGAEQYAYGPDNQRIWKLKADGTEELYYYDLQGHRLGTYPIYPKPLNLQNGNYLFYIGQGTTNVWFAGRMITGASGNVMQDRLGPAGNYYPYGESYAGSAPSGEAFATYYRDSSTLDYAQNRYYASSLARFTSPDPYVTTAGAADPGSWNRYAYAGNDPANSNDPSGLCIINGEEFRDPCFLANAYTSYDGGGGGGSGGPHRAYSDSDRPVRDSGGGDPIWSLMHSAVAMAIKALTSNEDCRGIFGNKDTRAGNSDPVKVLNSIFGSPNGGQYGKVSFLNLSPLGPSQ